MKTTKIAINGFGRIGRLAVRIMSDMPELELVAINDPFIDPDYAGYLLKHDTIHGEFNADVTADSENIYINNKQIQFLNEKEVEKINWKNIGADIILECSGKYTKYEDANKHLLAGAKKVIISAAGKNCPMFIMGVNEEKYDNSINIVAASSCTTNCLAPLAKVINNKFGIEEGLMTTVHSLTASQLTVDGPSKKDWRGGRSASYNIIPSTTGAAKAVGKVLPELDGKLTGMAFRVPTADVSVVDLTCKLKTPTTYEEIINECKLASATYLKGVMSVCEEPLVSSDFIGEPNTCVVDVNAGIMLNPTFVKLIAWYDNEYGYTVNMINLVKYIASKM